MDLVLSNSLCTYFLGGSGTVIACLSDRLMGQVCGTPFYPTAESNF